MACSASGLAGSALWHVLQISDQFFPTGAYAFSHALETYVAQGLVHDRHSCQQLLATLCANAIAPCDLVFCTHAYRHATSAVPVGQQTLQALRDLDHLLHASKVSRELRQESQHTGQACLRAAMALTPTGVLSAFWQQTQQGATPGHHAIAFGLVAQAGGMTEASTRLAYLYTVMASLVGAAVRLIPLGQSDGQRLLHDLAPLCLEMGQRYADLPPQDTWTSTPALDLRSMQHERLYSRLYRS